MTIPLGMKQDFPSTKKKTRAMRMQRRRKTQNCPQPVRTIPAIHLLESGCSSSVLVEQQLIPLSRVAINRTSIVHQVIRPNELKQVSIRRLTELAGVWHLLTAFFTHWDCFLIKYLLLRSKVLLILQLTHSALP